MKATAIDDFITDRAGHNLSAAQPGQGAVVIELDGDDDLPALHSRLTAQPRLALILGAVDSSFVHSLYIHEPDAREVEF